MKQKKTVTQKSETTSKVKVKTFAEQVAENRGYKVHKPKKQ